MSYGPGDNAFVIDRKSAEGGDKVQIFAEKTKAQLDKIYEQLNEDIRPASENERGLIRIASQHDVDLGLADASAITPLTLRNSQLAADVKDAKTQAGENAASIGTLGGEVAAAKSTAISAASVAQQALDAAQAGGGSGSIVPTADTFRAMPGLEYFPDGISGVTTDAVTALKLPEGGTWAYYATLAYETTVGGGEQQSGITKYLSYVGVAAGGTVIWYVAGNHTSTTGPQAYRYQTGGFIWKIAS